MSNQEYCVFVSDEIKDDDLIFRVLEVHCANGFVGAIRVTRQPACYKGSSPVWHYEIKDKRITLTGPDLSSVRFVAGNGTELAHVTVTNWELREQF